MLETISLLYVLEASVLLIGFVVYYKNKENKFISTIEELQHECNDTKKKYAKLESSLLEEKLNTKDTSYVTAEIQKREDLNNEIKRLKKSIVNAKIIAQDANMIKSGFLSNIHHEIRTPLNSILVFAELLEDALKDEKLNSFANNIKTSGRELLSLVENIIELSTLQTTSFEINYNAVDVKSYIEAIVGQYAKKAEKKGLLLSLNIDENVPESLMLDGEKVKDILDNLIDNAIKFTKKGEVEVNVVANNLNDANNTVDLTIFVNDTGKGIEKENQDVIFEIFEKKGNNNSLEFEGTGLGLSINRKLAELMNGFLTLQSKVLGGSSFKLDLNEVEIVLYKSNENIDESQIDFSLIKPENATIIVIDNNQDECLFIEENFKKSTVEVISFDNPRDAVNVLQRTAVSMIFIDLQILIEDDNAVSKVIKMTTNAPVVVLTSSSLKGIDFSNSGVVPVGHLKLPLSKIDLFQISLKLLHSQNIESKDTLTVLHEERVNLEGVDTRTLKRFLFDSEKVLKAHHEKALKTNNLNIITTFANAVLELSIKYQVDDMKKFATLLLKKVDLLEIDSISKMLKLYESKINQYKQFVKEK
jgi:signal transduction histidine kinase/CheY-like chemotaxis protein